MKLFLRDLVFILMKMAPVFVTILLVSSLGFSQGRLEFEVASIKPSSQQPTEAVSAGLHVDGSQVRYSSFSLLDYIAMAYRVKRYQISGPQWLNSERFEISAKLPDGATISQVPEMLQTLLADRFGLKFHRDSKDFPVYSLEVAKSGLKLKESTLEGDSDPAQKPSVSVAATGSANGVSINLGGGSYYSFANNHLEGKKLTMERFVDVLGRFMDRPVVDMTGLTGAYDLALDVTPEDYTAMLIRSAISAGVTLPPQAMRALDFSNGDSLINALQNVGLSLTPRKAPLDVLVIDNVQKTPTEQ